MKKLLALLLAGVLCLSVTACDGDGNETADTESPAASETVPVTDSEGTDDPDASDEPTCILGANDLLTVDPATGSGIQSAVANGNYITYTLSADNAHYNPVSNAKGDRVLSVKYRTDSTELAYVQITISSTADTPSDDSAIKAPIVADGEWHLMVLDLSEASGYDGENISYFQLGFLKNEQSPLARDGNATEVTIDVEYVAFFSSEASAKAYEDAETSEETTAESETTVTESETTVTEPETTVTEPEATVTEPEETTTEPEIVYSEGLEFVSNGDGTCRVKGIGTCTDSVLVIPTTSPNGDRVVDISGRSFRNLPSLTSVTIPNGVTSIGNSAFHGCSSLTSITIPDSVTSIGDYAFRDCSSLTSVTIPDSVTSIGNYVFNGCSSLTSMEVSVKNPVYHSAGNCIIEIASKTLIAGCNTSEIPTDNSVTSIGDYAFRDCSSLTSITVPDSVTTIGAEAFYGCSSLTSITIPDSVTIISSAAFSGCKGLADENGYVIVKCRLYGYFGNDTSVTIPDSVTSIGGYAFDGCKFLTSVTIPDSVTSIGVYAFHECSSLTSIVIPDSVTGIGFSAFRACYFLTSITIPDSVTRIGNETFYSCSSLSDVYYTGSAEEWAAIRIGSYNTPLKNAIVYYYAETQPAEAGNYWHYVDGVPTKW